ncbi:uncharacterized protein LOC129250109 [Anastrepha obliqua]|uniref:uncharacterized protein LOC129250109 n=1 Tax=Anastrepha obliqua TaxID=95512 RepID=UPI002409379D|nr:uncharacterized protein LOC129250109 [Anastrepha obliqua]
MQITGDDTAAGSTEASALAGRWPTVRITDPTKAGYLESRNAGKILKRLHETPPTTEELPKEAALTNVTLEVLLSNPDPPSLCTNAGWYQGQIKIITCDDERSVELYKATIARIGEVYPGAQLVMVDKKDIPSRPRARVWVPKSFDPENLQIISACNPGLPTAGWKFVKAFDNTVTVDGVVTKRATTQLMLLLTNDSLKPLAKSEGIINYGFGEVRIRTYKTDAVAIDQLASDIEANDAEEDPMESSSDVESIDLEGYCSSGSEFTARLKKMSTKKELLSESQEDKSAKNASPSNKLTS